MDPNQQIVMSIRQLINRLEDATTSERLDTLGELLALARSNPRETGELALSRILAFLKEQGSAEEYEESLDIIGKLLKSKDEESSVLNSSIVLSEVSNVELLLDLLEHNNSSIGIMASQILADLHSIDGRMLEKQIQECPEGIVCIVFPLRCLKAVFLQA